MWKRGEKEMLQAGRKKGIEMEVIHPHKDETYRIGFDDKCLVVSSGTKEDAPKVWISKSMAEWAREFFVRQISRTKEAPELETVSMSANESGFLGTTIPPKND